MDNMSGFGLNDLKLNLGGDEKGIALVKGERIALTKEALRTEEELTSILVGMGWDVPRFNSGNPLDEFDLDAVAFLLDESGKMSTLDDMSSYIGEHKDFPGRGLHAGQGSVRHHGDNRTGAGDGDDEKIDIDLSRVPARIQRIVLIGTIYNHERIQNGLKPYVFGEVSSAYLRIVSQSGKELLRRDLGENFSTYTSVIFGELYRYDNEWKFKSVEQGEHKDLIQLFREYGLDL